MERQNFSKLIRNFIIELIVYGILLVAYFYAVLRLLSDVLANLFDNNIVIYAFLGLGLIVAQGVVLEAITTFLLNRLQLDRLE